ncbi:MAG: hypothetical protein DRJ10_19650 [Bacteroidetes bacterium]|nr:MAG: hypothetical protein DRJ10_19650 [Bacteroidota bacterium]
MKKSNSPLWILVVLTSLIFVSSCIGSQKNKIKQLEDNIALLKEQSIPVRFKIIEKSNDSIQLVVKFYNADNKEINKLEQKMHGAELSFDFYVVPVKDRYVAFPSKIFTDKIAANDGIILYDYYNKENYPEIFNSKEMNPELYEGLKGVFVKIQSGQLDSLTDHFGNMVHDIKEFKSFLPGNVYSIVTHTKGGIEIIEE